MLYSEERLIALLQEKAAELGETPNMKHVGSDPSMPSIRSYYRCFGGWGKAIEAAGLAMRPDYKRRYSDEELIVALKKKAAKLGRTPKREDIEHASDMPCAFTFREHFGNWNRALEAAGLPLNRKKKSNS